MIKRNIKIMTIRGIQAEKILGLLDTELDLDKIDFSSDYLCNIYFIIKDKKNFQVGNGGDNFAECTYPEVDADLFIRTNGTCEEINFKKPQDAFNNLAMEVLEQKLKKKNEILKKARTKRKNQREELNKLNIKLQKSINLASHRKVVDWHIERNKALLAEIESLKQSSKISCNMLHQQQKSHEIVLIEVDAIQKLHKKEIEKLQAIIEYLEKKIK